MENYFPCAFRISIHARRIFALTICFYWWAVLGSNQWPLPCEGSALPLS